MENLENRREETPQTGGLCRDSPARRGLQQLTSTRGVSAARTATQLSFSLSWRQRIPRIAPVGSPLYLGSPVVYAKTISLKRYWYLAAVSAILASVFWSSAWLNSMIEPRPRL